MTSSKSTKRALISSALALLMCVTMLVGATFAWFTDTASTAVNKIQSGALKVDIVKADGETSIRNESMSFVNKDGSADILWEPGATFMTPAFKIKSTGSLALKYKLTLNGITGDNMLLKVIKFSVVKADGTEVDLDTFEGHLTPDAALSEALYIKGHMDETANNDYQGKTLEGLGITVVATQDTVENDSVVNQYDRYAQYPDVTVVQLAAGDETAVNNALKDAIAAAKTADAATGKPTPTQIVLPSNTAVCLDSGEATPAQGLTSDIKITGDKTTTVKLRNTNPGSEGSLSYQDGANLTFQGITVDTEEIKGICARGGVVTFIDCTFNSELKQTIAAKFIFSGCTFTKPVSQVGYGCKNVIFSNCKFDTDGYGIKIYSEGNSPVNLTVKNCAFNNSGSAAKSAIFLDHIKDGISYNITVDSCNFSGFTATPTANYNKWAARMIVADSFVKTSDGQYIFSYQTGAEGGSYHKILTGDQLVVTVK